MKLWLVSQAIFWNLRRRRNNAKIATRVFVGASLVFGVLGSIIVLTEMDPDKNNSGIELVVTKLFMVSIFVILTSFALSVAGKYLDNKHE